MNENEKTLDNDVIRFKVECLRLSAAQSKTTEELIENASKLFDWLKKDENLKIKSFEITNCLTN
jgi:hypothetical protein